MVEKIPMEPPRWVGQVQIDGEYVTVTATDIHQDDEDIYVVYPKRNRYGHRPDGGVARLQDNGTFTRVGDVDEEPWTE